MRPRRSSCYWKTRKGFPTSHTWRLPRRARSRGPTHALRSPSPDGLTKNSPERASSMALGAIHATSTRSESLAIAVLRVHPVHPTIVQGAGSTSIGLLSSSGGRSASCRRATSASIAIRQCQGPVLPSMFQDTSLTANEPTFPLFMFTHLDLHGTSFRIKR